MRPRCTLRKGAGSSATREKRKPMSRIGGTSVNPILATKKFDAQIKTMAVAVPRSRGLMPAGRGVSPVTARGASG
jgi:hypothetical protein